MHAKPSPTPTPTRPTHPIRPVLANYVHRLIRHVFPRCLHRAGRDAVCRGKRTLAVMLGEQSASVLAVLATWLSYPAAICLYIVGYARLSTVAMMMLSLPAAIKLMYGNLDIIWVHFYILDHLDVDRVLTGACNPCPLMCPTHVSWLGL